jgi:putative pyruvate formate lyase activating enzyme
VFAAQTEVSDELSLIPAFAIAFSGCHLRCDFCITGRESWNARAGQPFDAVQLAHQATEALAAGARTIMILGGEPTIHLPAVLELAVALPESATLVWKTNALATAQSRAWLEGLFDVWVADYKFGNDSCAQCLAGATGYTQVVRENLVWAARHCELIVRHLVMPGHVDCCWRPIAGWLAQALPQVPVNLRTGFWPAWRAHRHAELCTTVSQTDAAHARRIAAKHDLVLVD